MLLLRSKCLLIKDRFRVACFNEEKRFIIYRHQGEFISEWIKRVATRKGDTIIVRLNVRNHRLFSAFSSGFNSIRATSIA